MKLGTIYQIRARIRITLDGAGKLRITFRKHSSTPKRFHGKEVPYTQANPDDPALRYYICGNYFIPLNLYLPYLESTKDVEDADIAWYTDDTLNTDERANAYYIESLTTRTANPYPSKFMSAVLERCIKKLHKASYSINDIADLLNLGLLRVRNVLHGIPEEPARSEGTQDDPRNRAKRLVALNPEIAQATEYPAVKAAVAYARRKAYNDRIDTKFLITDVFPTIYDVHGDSGSHNGDRLVPRVCPVLRVPLDYNVFDKEKSPNKIRVWRKTPGPDGSAVMDSKNVTIMSTLAAWAVEGAYAHAKMREYEALYPRMKEYLAEWQARHGARTVPRETKVGRPAAIKRV